jgi:hypothetical protein
VGDAFRGEGKLHLEYRISQICSGVGQREQHRAL